MLDVSAVAQRHAAVFAYFRLQDIGEHLYVVSAGTVSLAHDGVYVAAVVVRSPCESELGQYLVEAVALVVVEN